MGLVAVDPSVPSSNRQPRGSALDPEIVSGMIGRRRAGNPLEGLTPRQSQVRALVAEGCSNRAVAVELVVSKRAVEKQVTAIFVKLELPATPEDHRHVLAVRAYLRAG